MSGEDIVSAAALDTIRTEHIDSTDDRPPKPIPVRWCPNPYTSILGHLVFSDEHRDGDTDTYSISFTAGPLHGEAPRYVLRFDPKEGTPDEQADSDIS